MVTGTHPEDVELFDYVEGDIGQDRRAQVEVHLATCAACADQVSRLQAGRDALRESQFLHLPPRRRDAIFMNLPEQRRAPGRSPALSPKRLLAVLTPIAAVAAVVVALVSSGGLETGRDEAGGVAAGTTSREMAQDQSGAEAAAPTVMKVAGPPRAVVDELRRKGLNARVVGNRVEVRSATRSALERALKDRRAGPVEIVLIP